MLDSVFLLWEISIFTKKNETKHEVTLQMQNKLADQAFFPQSLSLQTSSTSLSGQKHCLQQRTNGKLMDLHLVCMPSSVHPPLQPLAG